MIWIVKVLLESYTRDIWAETAVLKASLKRAFGGITGAPEHLAPSREATRAIRRRLPFASAAICTTHADQLHIHRYDLFSEFLWIRPTCASCANW